MTWNECPQDLLRSDPYDPRFYQSGMYTNDFNIQMDNGVMSKIISNSMIWSFQEQEEKKDWPVHSWNRPTIQWSLECEKEGKSRADGFEAFSLSLPTYDKIPGLRRVGIAMVVIFSVLACPCALLDEGLAVLVIAFTRLNFIIMMPILFVRTYGVRNFLSENIAKIDSF